MQKLLTDILFLLGWLFFTGLLALVGILMLVASDKSMGLLYRLLRMNSFSYPPWTTWPRWKWRAGGVIMTAGSLYMLFSFVLAFLSSLRK